MLMLQTDDGFDIIGSETNEASNETIRDFESKLSVKKETIKKKSKVTNTSKDIAELIFGNIVAANIVISNTG